MYQGNPYSQQPNSNPSFQNPYEQPPYSQNPSAQAQQALNFNGPMIRGSAAFQNQNFETENKGLTGDLFSNSRQSFVRKVYTILSIQLIITALVCVWAMVSPTFQKIFLNTAVIIALSVSLMVISIVVACCTTVMRKYGLPILIVFTLLESILVGICCVGTKPHIVLMAAGLTALVVTALTVYACFTKTDLTGCGPYLLILTIVLIVFGIVCIFWRNPIAQLVYSCLAALLFSFYLVFDTQLVLGKFQNSYGLDDAYIAAIQLYIDIIQIFLQLLRILSAVDN